jgi:excisionase family DNA binding protein
MIPRPSERPTLTVRETAEALRISPRLAYASIKDGSLPSIRCGGRVLVPTSSLRVLLGIDAPPGLRSVGGDE